MQTHLLGWISARCFKVFLTCWTWVFTHKRKPDICSDRLFRYQSITDFTKLFLIAGGVNMIQFLFISWLENMHHMKMWEYLASVAISNVLLVVAFWLAFDKESLFRHLDYHKEEWLRDVFVPYFWSRNCGSNDRGTRTLYLMVVAVGVSITVPNIVLFWQVSLAIVVCIAAVCLLVWLNNKRRAHALAKAAEKISLRNMTAALEQQLRENASLVAGLAVLKVSCKETKLINAAHAKSLMMARMKIIASKQQAKSPALGEARVEIEAILVNLGLTKEELDLIELNVCRILNMAPEKKPMTSATAAP